MLTFLCCCLSNASANARVRVIRREISLIHLTKKMIHPIKSLLEPTKNLYQGIVPKIGLEVHAQLNISSKLFSQGGNTRKAPPNTQLDLFDIALPGTLPKLNKNAVKAAIATGLGLNCTIQNRFNFDRKNYFYPDMPAGFQITQYNNPIAKNGYIDFVTSTYHASVIGHNQQYDIVKYVYQDDRKWLEEFEPYLKRSHIKQIQLEQDSAKSMHHKDTTLVDYNRSGAALVEIVFEPDLTNHHEASSLIKELMLILKSLETCSCELQEGSLRIDANVSIQSIAGQEVHSSSRVELKNLNSLKSLNKGILYEVKRQATLIEEGSKVLQESRVYESSKNRTVVLRVKEEAIDYRYVPEPSIPTVYIEPKSIEEIRNETKIDVHSQIREQLINDYNLELRLVMEIMEEGLHDYLKKVLKDKSYDPSVVADFLIYTVVNLKYINEAPIKVDLKEGSDFMQRLGPEKLQKLFDMMFADEVSFAIAYEVVKFIFFNGDHEPRQIVEKFNWFQITDRQQIAEHCDNLRVKMKNISKKYAKTGEKRYLRLMLDKLCQLTDNKVSVKKAIEMLDELLKPPKLRHL